MLTNNWILEVLADLKSFADLNQMPAIAAQMEQAQKIARAEIRCEEGSLGNIVQLNETACTRSVH